VVAVLVAPLGEPHPRDVTIEILHPGDAEGDGLVRHCAFPVPKWLLSGGRGVNAGLSMLRGRTAAKAKQPDA